MLLSLGLQTQYKQEVEWVNYSDALEAELQHHVDELSNEVSSKLKDRSELNKLERRDLAH